MLTLIHAVRRIERRRFRRRRDSSRFPRRSATRISRIGSGLLATIELEGEDAGVPVSAGAASVIFVVVHLTVPEGAVVSGVYAHAAVVAPALAVAGFHCSSFRGNRRCFHFSESIGGEPSCVPNAWILGIAGDAHPERNVARLVHGGASHPQAVRLVLKGSRLIQGKAAPYGRGAK